MMGLKNDCSHVLTMEIFMALLWVLPHFPTGPTVTEKELKEFSSSFKDVFFSCKMGFVDPGELVRQQVILSGSVLLPAGRRCNFERSGSKYIAREWLLSNHFYLHNPSLK